MVGASSVVTGPAPDGKEYGGRVTAFVVLSCITAGMGGVIFGYDIGISGGVTSMDPFLRKFFPEVYRRMKATSGVSNYCKFDSQLLTAFTSSLYVAGLVTTFLASWVTSRCGRRPSMIIAGAAFLAGGAIGGAAVDVYMVIFGRVLLGVGLGFGNQAVPLYLSEMAPPAYRGAFSNGFQLCVSIGAVTAHLINFGAENITGGWGWRVSLALAAVPGGILTLSALFLPETLNSLVQQGKDPDHAAALLKRIRGVDDVTNEMADIAAATHRGGVGGGLPALLFQRRYRPQLVMAVMVPFFQQVTGINAISFYAPVLLRTVGMGESASLLSVVVTGTVGLASTAVSMSLVDRAGRRTLFLAGGAQMLACQLVTGAVMATQLGDQGQVSRGVALVLVVLNSAFVAAFALSWGPLGWLVPSEIFPLEVRSAGQSVAVAINFLLTTFVAQSFLAMLCRMRSGIFFFFAAWLVIMTAFVYLLLPETKGKPIEQVGQLWGQHWFWKRFAVAGTAEDEEGRTIYKLPSN